jgi:hypothetical protein
MEFQFETSGKLKQLTDAELASTDAESAFIVYDDGILADGSHFWLYIAVKPSKYRDFMDKTKRREMINYPDYGDIIKFGRDEIVPAAIKDEMKQQYGFDDNYEAVVIDKFKKAQIEFLAKQEKSRIDDIVSMLKKNGSSNS